jgi:hypothetical protein
VGGGRPESALAGVWEIKELKIDGQPQPLLATNAGLWRRITFDLPNWAHLQLMDETLAGYRAALDTRRKTVALSAFGGKDWHANFVYERPDEDDLILDGNVNGQEEHVELRRMNSSEFPLTSRGFHWVQDYPFNH